MTYPRGATGTATVEVVVVAAQEEPTRPPPSGNTVPVAEARAKPAFVFNGRQVTFSGEQSTDAETPNRLRYRWSFGDGSAALNGKTVRKVYDRPGVYVAELVVTDPRGAIDRDKVKVHVLQRVTCQQHHVMWGGSWRSRSSSKTANSGTYCDNRGTGRGKDTLTLDFTGPRVRLNYGLASDGGRAAVFIDGTRVGLISFEGRIRAPLSSGVGPGRTSDEGATRFGS